MDLLLVSILQLGMGVFWSITYLLIIKKGFQDKTAGMPMTALCANISWEFIFSFIYPHNGLQRIIDIIWLILDFIIILQFLSFGRKEFEKTLPAKFFYPVFLFTLTLSFTIIMSTVTEFDDLEGKYAAFSQNLLMSILFISMLIRRGNSKGQSIFIAIFKMLGSVLPAIGFFFYFKSNLIILLSTATLLFDLIYIVLLYKYSRLKRVRTIASSNFHKGYLSYK
ncbi:MAG: putative rane protein [Clostridiales bacterium]|nr:putative rane protein [Clostridiales bacterium]